MDKRRGGGITFFRQKFLSHSGENFRGDPFIVSENLGYGKFLSLIGGFHEFPSKIFCLIVPKNFVGNPYWFQKISGVETWNFSCIRKNALRFSVVIINLKDGGKGLDSNPYLLLQNLVVLLTVPWEPLESKERNF